MAATKPEWLRALLDRGYRLDNGQQRIGSNKLYELCDRIDELERANRELVAVCQHAVAYIGGPLDEDDRVPLVLKQLSAAIARAAQNGSVSQSGFMNVEEEFRKATAGHLSPSRLIALAFRTKHPTGKEQKHLKECRKCRMYYDGYRTPKK